MDLELLDKALYPMAIALILFLVRDFFSSRGEKLKEHANYLRENTLAITKLTIEMENLKKYIYKIDKLETDMHHNHDKIRTLEAKMDCNNTQF